MPELEVQIDPASLGLMKFVLSESIRTSINMLLIKNSVGGLQQFLAAGSLFGLEVVGTVTVKRVVKLLTTQSGVFTQCQSRLHPNRP